MGISKGDQTIYLIILIICKMSRVNQTKKDSKEKFILLIIIISPSLCYLELILLKSIPLIYSKILLVLYPLEKNPVKSKLKDSNGIQDLITLSLSNSTLVVMLAPLIKLFIIRYKLIPNTHCYSLLVLISLIHYDTIFYYV